MNACLSDDITCSQSRHKWELCRASSLKGTWQLLPCSPSVKCICSTWAFVAPWRWHGPGVRGLHPTVATHCENMHSHCIQVKFNLDQVSSHSQQLYWRSCNVINDCGGNGGWDTEGPEVTSTKQSVYFECGQQECNARSGCLHPAFCSLKRAHWLFLPLKDSVTEYFQ